MYSYYHLTPEADFRKVTFLMQDHCKQTPISKASSQKGCHEAIILCYVPDLLNIYFFCSNLFLVVDGIFFLEREATVLNEIKKILKQPTKKEMELVNKYLEVCSLSLFVKEIKCTSLRYCFNYQTGKYLKVTGKRGIWVAQ